MALHNKVFKVLVNVAFIGMTGIWVIRTIAFLTENLSYSDKSQLKIF